MKKLITLFFFCGTTLFGCKTATNNSVSGYYTYKTECIGVELDGSQTLKSWGTGSNKSDSIEQAYKNAIKDVLFNGINNGKTDCTSKPVLFEVNAKERYEEYFNKFFMDGGLYEEFVSNKDGSTNKVEVTMVKEQPGSQFTYSVIVRVLKAKLRQKMITDGILKIN